MIGAKPLCFMFDTVDEFIRDYNGTKYLLSLGSEKYMSFSIGLDISDNTKNWYFICCFS